MPGTSFPRKSFPLVWPDGWKRTKSRTHPRKFVSRFAEDRDSTIRHIVKMCGTNIVITSNLPTSDGRSYASNLVEDPRIAVWWIQTKVGQQGQERVLACDRWSRPTDNLHAINKSLDAMRGLDRWGAQEMVERAFSGFAALPSGEAVIEDWRDVLGDGLPADLDGEDLLAVVKSRYKKLATKLHPDVTGDSTSMLRLNAAMERAENELGT